MGFASLSNFVCLGALQDEHIGELFQDEDNLAAVLLHRDPDGSLLLVSKNAASK